MKLWPPGVFPVHEIREAWRGETAPGKSSESLLEKDAILSAHAIEVGQTVLDAGCGNGYMLKEFSQLVGDGGKVYALDPDETAIALLREETEGTNMVALVGDVTATTQLPASAIDLIYLSTVFHIFSPEQIKGFEAGICSDISGCLPLLYTRW